MQRLSTSVEMTGSVVSPWLYGQGLLDRVISEAYSRSPRFRELLAASAISAVRWPNAGHDNLEESHAFNRHTNFFKDFPNVRAAGNTWDTTYNYGDAAPRTEILTIEALADLAADLGLMPCILLTWKSAYRTSNGGVPFRDPEPYDIDGNSLPVGTGTPVEQQLLENRRVIKAYFDRGGPDPIIMVGGEDLYIGWDNAEPGFVPWPDVKDNGLAKATWLSQTVAGFYRDAQAFVQSLGRSAWWGFAFEDSKSAGTVVPITANELANIQARFRVCLANLGPLTDHVMSSVHYRKTWAEWLLEDEMQFAFFTDIGQGSIREIREFVREFAASEGYPWIDFVPYANSVGELDPPLPKAEPWQRGLMAAQYLMECANAGIEHWFGFPGIIGDHKNAGATPSAAAAAMGVPAPMFHALAMIGEVLAEAPTLLRVLIDDPGLVALGLSWVEEWRAVHGVYLLNKQGDRRVTVTTRGTGAGLPKSVQVKRYSASEPQTAVVADANPMISNRHITIDLAAFSLTRIILRPV